MIPRPSDIRGPFDFAVMETAFPDQLDPSRIVITGANGAGKSWLATRLGQDHQQPVIHKDALALLRGWSQRPKAEVQEELKSLLAQKQWVLDTGPSGLTHNTLSRATLVIWLDLPAWLRFWRVLTRTLRYLGRTRPEHPAGNRDWPGRRQWRFLTGTLRNHRAFDQAISLAVQDASVVVFRLTRQRDVAPLRRRLKAAGQGAERL